MAAIDTMEERLARMEGLLNQLIGLVAKTNNSLIDLESRLNQRMDDLEQQVNRRIDGLEQRLEPAMEGQRRDVIILKSESDHLARKVGVIEGDLAVLRNQS